MKTIIISSILFVVIILGHFTTIKAESIGTMFTYEGLLMDGDMPAEGLYDFEFVLYDSPDPNYGIQIGYINIADELEVSNGFFKVDLDLSFGDPNVFNGQARWLEISYRPGEMNDPNEYTIIETRYEILPVPYALYAASGTPGPTLGIYDSLGLASSGYRAAGDAGRRPLYNLGNVGIGTATPGANLEVNGLIKITGGSPGEGKVLSSNASGLASWKTPKGDDMGDHTATQNIKLNGKWLSCDGGNEGIYVQSNGYVGIGTSTPDAFFVIDDESNTPGQVFRISNSGAIRAPETGLGGLAFDTYQYIFPQGWKENMVITGLGYVGIGTSTPSAKLDVNGTVKASKLESSGTVEASELALNSTSDEGDITRADRIIGYNDLRFYGDEGDIDMRITTGGNIGIGKANPSYKLDVNGTIRGEIVGPSDERLKKEIKTIDNALERVTSLHGTNFKWIDEENGEALQLGVIAQEVEKVFPEAVSIDDQGYKSVAYGNLVAPLIEAIKELKEENDLLKEKVEALEKKLQ